MFPVHKCVCEWGGGACISLETAVYPSTACTSLQAQLALGHVHTGTLRVW